VSLKITFCSIYIRLHSSTGAAFQVALQATVFPTAANKPICLRGIDSSARRDKHATNCLTQIRSLYSSSALLDGAGGFLIFKSPLLQLAFITLDMFTGFLAPCVNT